MSPLSLGNGSKENEGCLQFHSNSYNVQNGRGSSSNSPFKGLVMTLECSPLWNGVYPNFIPNEVNRFILFLNFIIWNQLHIRLSTWISHIEFKDMFIGRECQIGKDYSTDGVMYNLWFWVAWVGPCGDQTLFFGC